LAWRPRPTASLRRMRDPPRKASTREDASRRRKHLPTPSRIDSMLSSNTAAETRLPDLRLSRGKHASHGRRRQFIDAPRSIHRTPPTSEPAPGGGCFTTKTTHEPSSTRIVLRSIGDCVDNSRKYCGRLLQAPILADEYGHLPAGVRGVWTVVATAAAGGNLPPRNLLDPAAVGM